MNSMIERVFLGIVLMIFCFVMIVAAVGCSSVGGKRGGGLAANEKLRVMAAAALAYWVGGSAKEKDNSGALWSDIENIFGSDLDMAHSSYVAAGVAAAQDAPVTGGAGAAMSYAVMSGVPEVPESLLTKSARFSYQWQNDPNNQVRFGQRIDTTSRPGEVWVACEGLFNSTRTATRWNKLVVRDGRIVIEAWEWREWRVWGYGPTTAEVSGGVALIGDGQYDGKWQQRRWRGAAFVVVGDATRCVWLGENVGDWAGRAVGVADIDGDGVRDIIIGAPFARPWRGGQQGDGAVFVIAGADRGTGDANCDGAITMDDALAAASFFLAKEPNTIDAWRADVDGDWVVTNRDALIIARRLLASGG